MENNVFYCSNLQLIGDVARRVHAKEKIQANEQSHMLFDRQMQSSIRPRLLPIDIKDAATNFYFENFTHLGRPEGLRGYLRKLYNRGGPDTVFKNAVIAVGMAGLANIAKNPIMRQAARQQYVAAISKVNEALSRPSRPTEDGVVMSVMMLSMFEPLPHLRAPLGCIQHKYLPNHPFDDPQHDIGMPGTIRNVHSPSGHDTKPRLTVPKSLEASHYLGAEIAASLPFHLGFSKSSGMPPPHKRTPIAGGLFSLWPLYILGSTSSIPEDLRAWSAERLIMIGKNMGIQTSSMLAWVGTPGALFDETQKRGSISGSGGAAAKRDPVLLLKVLTSSTHRSFRHPDLLFGSFAIGIGHNVAFDGASRPWEGFRKAGRSAVKRSRQQPSGEVLDVAMSFKAAARSSSA
ncbi:hypothetical protein V502_01774 [Pseudogymnoascus sp. VKM F-4520 (FW-2644)]|nr:hypothetical protein V502_01774 [Pseudogymnoascus sp. VKM F-4520 (FW-2644)]